MADRRASPLVIAKTHLPPRRAEILRRPRLVDYLFAQIEKQLFFISAPAGYGKTSLLVDFAHEADFAIAWYALDEFDNSPHTFLEYLIAAIRVPFPRFGAQALAALERANDSLDSLQPVVALIANELYRLPDHLVIILDDYHIIHNELIDQLIAIFVRYAGDNCHLFIDSRMLPRIPDQILLLARGQMDGISINHLKFTASEIQALIQQNYHLSVPEQRAHELAQATDGWITALLLMGHQAGWRELIEGAIAAPDATGRIYDYLAEQIFTHQPPDLQRFLLGSSVMDPLAPEILDRLPHMSGSSRHLARLHAQQLFITRLGGSDEAYTYHPLFREFLRARLQRDDAPWYEQLALASASIYAEQQQWERVVEIYLSLHRSADAAQALEAAEESLRSNSQVTSLTPWLEALPRELLHERPRLMSLHAKRLFFRGELEQAAALFEQAATMLRESGADAAAADKRIWKVYALQGLGRYQQALDESRAIETWLNAHPAQVRLRVMNLIQQGQCQFSLGRPAEAYTDLLAARELSLTTDDLVTQANVTQDLGVIARSSGRLSEALEHYSSALNIWERLGNRNAAAPVLNNLGYLYYLKGETQEAVKILQDALTLARQAGTLRYESIILSTLGDIYKDSADYSRALEFYADGLRVAQEAHYAYGTQYCRYSLGEAYRLTGDYAHALEWLNAALESAQTSHSLDGAAQTKLALALLAADQGQLIEARLSIESVYQDFRAAGNKQLEALGAFHLAHLYNLQGDQQQSVAHLRRIAELVKILGYDQFLVVAGQKAELTLRLGASLDDVGSTFQHMLTRVKSISHEPSSKTAAHQSPELMVHTLGQERFMLRGVEVHQLRPQVRELFHYLLARHPHGARRDELWELMWPGLSEGRADASLRVTVTRIRRALCPITVSNGWYALGPEQLWYDVKEFESALALARQTQGSRDQIPHLEKAIELYGGDYLTRLQADWAVVERERLRRLYLTALMTLAEAYSETQDFSAALRTYEKASTEEPYFEVAWLGVMQTLAQTGNRAAAVAHYEKLKTILQQELGVEPSREVQGFYRRLLDMNA